MSKAKKNREFVVSNGPTYIKGVTPCGYKYAIDTRALKDYRLVEAVGQMNSDDTDEQAAALTQIVKCLFRDKKNEFLEFLADEDGFVDSEKVFKEIAEIFKQHGETAKNS